MIQTISINALARICLQFVDHSPLGSTSRGCRPWFPHSVRSRSTSRNTLITSREVFRIRRPQTKMMWLPCRWSTDRLVHTSIDPAVISRERLHRYRSESNNLAKYDQPVAQSTCYGEAQKRYIWVWMPLVEQYKEPSWLALRSCIRRTCRPLCSLDVRV